MSKFSILQKKHAVNLKIFLEDLGYYTWEYKYKPVLIFGKYFDCEGNERNALNEKGSLENVFKRINQKSLENLFIQINRGKTYWTEIPYKHKTEGRKKSDIIFHNAFMLDFDLKDERNEHYKGKYLRKKKSELLRKIWYKLPLKPDYIVESRNGFHVYYLIHLEERRMSSEQWHRIEIGIFDYVKKNISDNVDHAVKKSNQIMRLPYSFHKKDDDNDEGFQVKIIYERNRKLKEEFFDYDFYDSAMFAYSTKNLISKFDIEENKKALALHKPKQIKISVEHNSTAIKYPSIEAIKNEDAKFFSYLQKNIPEKSMTRREATEYIKNFDIREVLGFNDQPLNTAFSSLFYEDKNPSDYFAKNQFGNVVYYCRAENHFYNDIFNIVYRLLNFETETSEKSKWRKIFNLVYKMFGIEISRSAEENSAIFDKVRSDNLKILKTVSKHSKQTKYLGKFVFKLYEMIMNLWKEHSDRYNLAWREMHKTLSVNYLSKRLEKKQGDSKISKGLMILESLGLIERVDSVFQIDTNLPSANEYKFPILRNEDLNKIIFRAEQIKKNYNKPINEVTRKKLLLRRLKFL